jgi:hypothetical protein
METMGFTFGIMGFIFSMAALQRIANLEKKLKQFDVIPRDFNSEKDVKDTEGLRDTV